VRDCFRKLTSSFVSEDFAKLVQAWTEVILLVDHTLSTSVEQDERFAIDLRDSRARLREIEDDHRQVSFELMKEKEARSSMNQKYIKMIDGLREQLRETQQISSETVLANEKSCEHGLNSSLTSYEIQVLSIR
jgi:hypothetical protein